ncbi:MAG: ferredoxin, partial [Deltaproteobacteria bacterium]
MAKYMVSFMPTNRSAMVEEGTTIAEAARQADVFIKNLCGGEGVCGQCRVQITSGKAEADEQARAFFSEEEIERGYVLACQTEVHDNLEVLIPPETRMEGAKIMTGEAAGPEAEGGAKPLVRKIFLEMPEPTLEDNISDIERVSRELRRKIGWHSYEISLSCLRRLSEKLRDSQFKVTASVAKRGGGYKILRIDPGDTTSSHYGLAVDVGTTTVVAQLVEMSTGRILGVSGTHNLQASFGEDVISRIIYACKKDGLGPVHEAVIKNINQLIDDLTSEKNISRDDIIAMVAAGNTTMSHLLLGLLPCSIRLEPYVPTADIYPQIYAREIGVQINPEGILETLPSVASYVGGDIVAGVLACGIPDHPEVRGLIDIGTNGEIAIGNN